jgi:hypothetical protein
MRALAKKTTPRCSPLNNGLRNTLRYLRRGSDYSPQHINL